VEIQRKWRPKKRPQDVRVGRYFMASDFLYSEMAVQKGVVNCPMLDSPEVEGMKGLCQHILDLVVDLFGSVSITFGYNSPELWRKRYGQTVDLAGLHSFRPSQGGIGGAADILVHSHPEDPRPVLNWIRDNCIYDRLIIYPGSAILCVAWTDIEPRMDCKEWIFPEIGAAAFYLEAGRSHPPTPPRKRGQSFDQGKLFRQRTRSKSCKLSNNRLKWVIGNQKSP
jgi:hypothetical protein